VETSTLPQETLAEVLGARARRTPSDRLVIDVVGGVLIAAASIWARPLGWFPLLAVAACFACYGTWALAERRAASAARAGAWRILARAAGAFGVLAFVLLLFVLLGVALGPMIS
jgi:hypothetical protein